MENQTFFKGFEEIKITAKSITFDMRHTRACLGYPYKNKNTKDNYLWCFP